MCVRPLLWEIEVDMHTGNTIIKNSPFGPLSFLRHLQAAATSEMSGVASNQGEEAGVVDKVF